ncbi:MAG: hypothetical protein M9887_12325 [Chitinophagales bacterium]|nr:hypothetical protein [Chitinophagales bacterium]
MDKKVSLGVTRHPANLFMFHALQNQKIDLNGYQIDIVAEDEVDLFEKVKTHEIDILKLNTYAASQCMDKYRLSENGNSIGRECGSLLIAKKDLDASQIKESRIGVSNQWSIENFYLSFAYPNAKNVIYVPKGQLLTKLLADEVDAVVFPHSFKTLIEENNLQILSDLGEYWENLTWLLCPIESLLINKNIEREAQVFLSDLIRKSIQYAFQNKEEILTEILNQNPQLGRSEIENNLGLYVNDYSLNLGSKGKTSVNRLFEIVKNQNPGNSPISPV